MRFSEIFIRRVYTIGLLLVIVLVLLDLLTYFFYPETIFGKIFLATREQTPLTWLSSLSFLFIGLSAFSVYLDTRRKLWYFLAATFLFFSMDDATYFHERMSGYFSDNVAALGAFPGYVWTILYFPLLVFSLSAFVWLAWKDALKAYRRPILLALGMLILAESFDLIDGLMQKGSLVFCFEAECQKVAVHLSRLTEEVLEVVALGLLGYTNIREHCLRKDE